MEIIMSMTVANPEAGLIVGIIAAVIVLIAGCVLRIAYKKKWGVWLVLFAIAALISAAINYYIRH